MNLGEAAATAQLELIQQLMPTADSLKHPSPSMGEVLEPVEPEPPPSAEIFHAAEPPKDARFTCRFLLNELFIAMNRNVAPCCTQGRSVVGNVFQQNLDTIWNGPGMSELLTRLHSGNPLPCCRDCNDNTMLGHGDYKEETFFVPLKRDV